MRSDDLEGANPQIIEGDAFEELAILPDDHGHAAIVDYPWRFAAKNGAGRFNYVNKIYPTGGEGENVRDPAAEDAMFNMESDDRVPELLDLLADKLVDGAWLLFFADDRFQDVVRDAMRDHDEWVFRRNWAWSPESMGMGYYGRINHYPIPVATLGETDRKVKSRPTLYSIPGGRDTEWDTGKPVELYRRLLAPPVLHDGERLLEPFCGGAPGAAIAVERGLDYWGCDLKKEAIEMARNHYDQTRLTASAGWGEVNDA